MPTISAPKPPPVLQRRRHERGWQHVCLPASIKVWPKSEQPAKKPNIF
jgi:hypothetical protein